MIQLCTYTTNDLCPTQHAMLIVWGHFARTLGLLDHLATLPIHQKTVTHAPHQKIVEFLIGLLSGMEYLTDLSSGPTPLVRDHAVATAWQVEGFAAASTVSRTLKASDRQTVMALRAALDAVGQPFLDRAIAEMRKRHQRLLLSADLTGRPGSSTSRTYPDAAFGYMGVFASIHKKVKRAGLCLSKAVQLINRKERASDRDQRSDQALRRRTGHKCPLL